MGIGKRVCGVANVHVEWLGSRWVDRGQLPMEREMKVLVLMTDELSKRQQNRTASTGQVMSVTDRFPAYDLSPI